MLRCLLRTLPIPTEINLFLSPSSDFKTVSNSYLSMALQPFPEPWPLFQFLNLYTVCRTPWTGDQPVARSLPTHRTTQTDIHALSGIRTHYPSARAGEDSSCLRPRGHCHQQQTSIYLMMAQWAETCKKRRMCGVSILPIVVMDISGYRIHCSVRIRPMYVSMFWTIRIPFQVRTLRCYWAADLHMLSFLSF
jgi:hypothetical protein